MKSLRKKILASALAVTLLGGAFMPKANAAPVIPTETNEKIWKDLKITKILNKVEKGVTTPEVEFEFSFKAKTPDAPNIENVKIGYTTTDDTDADKAEAGVQVEKTEGVDLSKIEWTKPGIYEYELKEVIPDPGTGIKDMDYAYVFDEKGRPVKQGTNQFRGFQIKFKVEKVNGKLDVTGITVAGKYGKFTRKINYDKGIKFLNYYNKKDGNTPVPGGGTDLTEPDKKGFAFQKIVDSEKQADLDETFEFDLNVAKPKESHLQDTSFKYVVVDKDGKVGEELIGPYDTVFKIELKDKERVVFTDVILGSKVTVGEADTKGLTLSVEALLLEKNDVEKGVTGIIGDNNGGNYAKFTNKNVPLTGVLIDNLPYIALVAVAGLGIFFFVKNRREEEIYA